MEAVVISSSNPKRRLPRDYNFETAMESALNFIPQNRVIRVGGGDMKEEMEYQWGDGE